jgi:SAM-dependent methyltransferase
MAAKAMTSDAPVAGRCVACGGEDLRLVYETPDFAVLRCKACTMAQAPDLGIRQAGSSKVASSSTPDEKLDEYRDTFEQMKALCLRSMDLRIPFFEKLLGRPLRSVCEVGCANGVGYFAFKQRGIDWIGLDTNPRWIEFGRQHGIPIVARDLADVEERFDLIYTQQVLEHIAEPLPFLEQARERLAPGGILHVAVPNHSGFTALARRMLPKMSPTRYGFIEYPYHMRAYNRKSLGALLQRAGFKDIHVRAIEHTDLCWGEWDTHSIARRNRMIFGAGGKVGLGTLLFAYARKP